MAVGESTATTGAGDVVSTYIVDEIDGVGPLSEREIQLIRIGYITALGKIRTVDALNGLPVVGDVTATIDDSTPVEVRGDTSILRPTLSLSTAAYAQNDVVGGEVSLTSLTRDIAKGAVINSINAWFADGFTPELDFLFFETDLTGGTYTDNGALTLSTTDTDNWLSIETMETTNWRTIVTGGANDTFCTLRGLGIPVKGDGVVDLRMLIVTKTAFTLTATSRFRVSLGLLRD